MSHERSRRPRVSPFFREPHPPPPVHKSPVVLSPFPTPAIIAVEQEEKVMLL